MLPCVRVCLFTDMPLDQLHRGPLSRGLRTSARLLIGGVHLGEIGLWQTSSSIGVLRAYRRHHRVRACSIAPAVFLVIIVITIVQSSSRRRCCHRPCLVCVDRYGIGGRVMVNRRECLGLCDSGSHARSRIDVDDATTPRTPISLSTLSLSLSLCGRVSLRIPVYLRVISVSR